MTAPQLAQETIDADEESYFADLAQRLQNRISQMYQHGIMRRDAHPKMHGLVRASFEVEHDLPPELRVGVFQPGKHYQTWVRFSNQNGSIQDDHERDIRGVALKLMQVPGAKLLPEESDAPTHDFILISTKVFVTRNAREFDDLVQSMMKGWLPTIGFFLTHLHDTLNLLKSSKVFGNPLHIHYYSTTPYLFGPGRAVKYCLRPHHPHPDPVPDDAGPDFMREAMAHQLRNHDAKFDFMVQFQTDAQRMPIEDPSEEWDEKESPFIKLATLRIAQQQFDTPEQRVYGDNLSFSPWHALPEHRPLGSVNRARRVVYDAISRFRHLKNGVVRKEPSHFEI